MTRAACPYCGAKSSTEDIFDLVPLRLRPERDEELFKHTCWGEAFLAEGYACAKVSKEDFLKKDAKCPFCVTRGRF